jgi:hypothetical protein
VNVEQIKNVNELVGGLMRGSEMVEMNENRNDTLASEHIKQIKLKK